MPDTLAVLHVADLFREPRMRLPSLIDWRKIPRYLGGDWPRPIPPRTIIDGWQPGEIDDWFKMALTSASFVVLDTEYNRHTKYLTLLGLGYPEMAGGLQLVWPSMPPPIRDMAKQWLALLVENVPTVFQNQMADIPVLDKNLGIPYEAYKAIDDTLLADALLWSEWPHDLKYLASLYSPYRKMKHLADSDPLLYNWGDVLDTIATWQALREQLARDPRTEHIYRTRSLPLAPILMRATAHGIRVDQARAKQALLDLEAACLVQQTLAQAECGYPINLASPAQVIRQLQWDGVKTKSVESEAVGALLLKHPDNDLLRARMRWAQAEGFRRYVAGIADRERVYPDFLPTQATGRISVTNPPLANFPDSEKAANRGLPALRECFVPDEGEVWVCWDWSALHARFMAAVTNDNDDLTAYETGADIHLTTARRALRKETIEPRERHLMKTVRYALLNGLDHRSVRESKEVAEQGLDIDELERFAKAFLAAKPGMVAWKRQYAMDAIRAGEARSLYGRKRRLVGVGERAVEDKMKAAISGFLQMTEVDIMTETLVEVCRRYPQARLVFPSHDGIKLAFPADTNLPALLADLRPWVERPHRFSNGVTISLPATFEGVYADGRHELAGVVGASRG